MDFSSSKLEINTKDYEIGERISRYGLSKVYVLKNKNTGLLYAAKIIDCHNDENEVKEILDNLIKIHLSARHQTIVKFIGYALKDIFSVQQEHCIILVTKYAENKSLSDVLEKIRAKSLENYNNTTRQIILIGIARGMKYLHDHNILHRDLKPGNVLINKNFHPKICDFGNAKFFKYNNSTSRSKVYGTAAYEAPEIITGSEYNTKIDVYAFGILMYEVLTDLVPYPELKNGEITDIQLRIQVSQNYRPTFDTPVKESLQILAEKCWSADPNERPIFRTIFSELTNPANFLDGVDECVVDAYVKKITEANDAIDCLVQEKENLTSQVEQLQNDKQNMSSQMQQMNDEIHRLRGELQRLTSSTNNRSSSNDESANNIHNNSNINESINHANNNSNINESANNIHNNSNINESVNHISNNSNINESVNHVPNNSNVNESVNRVHNNSNVDRFNGSIQLQTYPQSIRQIKIAFVGPSGGGKTSIINRYTVENYKFDEKVDLSTIGSGIINKKVTCYDGLELNVNIWDTGGQEKFLSLIPIYVKDSSGIVIVYDISKPDSFDQLDKIMEFVDESIDLNETEILILANKNDIEGFHTLEEKAETMNYREILGRKHELVSAKTNQNIKEVMDAFIDKIYRNNPNILPQQKLMIDDDQNDQGCC